MDEDLEFLHTGFGANASAEKTLNILYGVLLGFIADGVIQDEEKEYLKKKRREHDEEGRLNGSDPSLRRSTNVSSTIG